MSHDFQKTEIKQYPALLSKETSESKYWGKFKFPVVTKEFSAVNSIDFCPTAPYDFVISSSTRLRVYSLSSNTCTKNIARFKDVVRGASFRSDGKLLVAGCDNSTIQVFDAGTRAPLRQFSGHTRSVYVTRFGLDGSHIFSASDDYMVKVWDLATGLEVRTMEGHTDYVRSGAVNPSSPHTFLTGSYDHSLRLWDTRVGECVAHLPSSFSDPVEAVLYYPSGTVFAASGGSCVKVFDLLNQGRTLASFTHHQKTVTCLSLDSRGRRLLTGSLDRFVKIQDTADYSLVHSIKHPVQITSLGFSPNETHLVVGAATGLLTIKHRRHLDDLTIAEASRVKREADLGGAQGVMLADALPTLPTSDPSRLRRGTRQFYVRGKEHGPSEDAFSVALPRRKKLTSYEKLIKKFKYGEALDAVFHENSKPIVVISVLHELAQRSGLLIALNGRNEKSLAAILSFLYRHIAHPRYSSILIDVCNLVLDLYAPGMGLSPRIDELFVKLQAKLHAEIVFQQQLHKFMGMMDTILSA